MLQCGGIYRKHLTNRIKSTRIYNKLKTKTTAFRPYLKHTQTLVDKSLFIYNVIFLSTAFEVIWPYPHLESTNLIRHKSRWRGLKKPKLPRGRKSRRVGEDRGGGWVSLSLQKPSYPRDIKALHSEHTKLSEWYDSPQGELVRCKNINWKKDKKEEKWEKGRKGKEERIIVEKRWGISCGFWYFMDAQECLCNMFLMPHKETIMRRPPSLR